MEGSMIRSSLRNVMPVYGTHIAGLENPVTDAMRSSIQLDFVFICTEHMPLDRGEVSRMCIHYRSQGISPIVRIPYPSPELAAMYLDGGAEGITAPYVESRKEVEALVGAVRYRPIKGAFLNDILAGRRNPAHKLQTYLDEFNRNTYLIIGIESTEAVRSLDDLISVKGVDGVFIGPHDLTCSMEIPEEYDSPEFTDAVSQVIRTCRKQGIGAGIHMDLTSERARQFIKAGMNFMLHSSNITIMKDALTKDLKTLRQEYQSFRSS